MTPTQCYNLAQQQKAADELRSYRISLDRAINALYRTLPNGQRNYGENSEIGSFGIKHFCGEMIEVIWNPSKKYKKSSEQDIYQNQPRGIVYLYLDSREYDLNESWMPQRLAKDTQRVMELLGFEEDDLRGCSGDDW